MPGRHIAWDDDKFGTGVTSIDNQHRELVAKANRVLDLVTQGYVDGALLQPIEELISHAREHFAYEEQLMASYGCPDIDSHIREHAKLLEQLQTLKKNVPPASGQRIKVELFSAYLIDLVELHIAQTDVNFLSSFAGK